jgi:Tfp pilus assembly protein PilF
VTVAGVCLGILYKAKPSNIHFQRVEQLLTAAIQKERTAVLLDYLGALHNLQGDLAAAATDFRAALALEANDLTALNNLSWLLAFQPSKNAEALEMVNRVIKIAGPHPGVLDTRGVIHLTAGRAAQAVQDLEDAVAEAPTASRYFHLAQAHQLAKNRTSAMAALMEANRLGLNESGLNALERTAYQRLCVQLGMEKE